MGIGFAAAVAAIYGMLDQPKTVKVPRALPSGKRRPQTKGRRHRSQKVRASRRKAQSRARR